MKSEPKTIYLIYCSGYCNVVSVKATDIVDLAVVKPMLETEFGEYLLQSQTPAEVGDVVLLSEWLTGLYRNTKRELKRKRMLLKQYSGADIISQRAVRRLVKLLATGITDPVYDVQLNQDRLDSLTKQIKTLEQLRDDIKSVLESTKEVKNETT